MGANDDFFALGGHSLLGAQVIARLASAGGKLSLRDLFEAPTLGEFSSRVEAIGSCDSVVPPLVPVRRDQRIPLSFAQEEIWLVDRLHPGRRPYYLSFTIHFDGAPELASLRSALAELIRRHEALRTRFVAIDGVPEQQIGAPYTPTIRCVGLSDADSGRIIRETIDGPFDLTAGPLLRACCVRHDTSDFKLLVTIHHIVCDGWSVAVFEREMRALYDSARKSEPPPLTDLPVQYADYATWLRATATRSSLDAHVDYWKTTLEGAPHVCDLPTDRARPVLYTFEGARRVIAVPGDRVRRLCELGRQHGAMSFVTLMAAFCTYLSRLGRRTDLVVGTPVANRKHPHLEGIIGLFVNMLPIRVLCPPEEGFLSILRRVREQVINAFAHQELPFSSLVNAILDRRTGHHPLFQIVFAVNEGSSRSLEAIDLRTPGSPFPCDTAFDLSLSMSRDRDHWFGVWEYRTDLFDDATIARMARQFETLIDQALSQPERPIGTLRLIEERERAALLAVSLNNAFDIEQAPVHRIFETRAARTPEALALVAGEENLTCQALNRRSNGLAHVLLGLGVKPETRIGICLERSADFVVAILAVWKAGCAYIPLDPDHPGERLDVLLDDSLVEVLITRDELAPRFAHRPLQILSFARSEREDNPNVATRPNSLAYIIYTSGTTGRPKGAMIEHVGLSNLARGQAALFRLGPDDRLLAQASFCFDASVAEMLLGLSGGVVLCLPGCNTIPVGRELERVIDDLSITTIIATPSVLATLDPDRPTTLCTVIAAAEVLPQGLAARWARRHRLFNAYGPTETSVCTTAAKIDGHIRPPIGSPLPNVRTFVLDASFELVPTGVPGELYVGGIGVGRGYCGLPALTAERFIPDPFSLEPGSRLYKTGDVVRYLPSKEIEFVGRTDNQIKLRGYRIEIEEIEAALAMHPGVGASAVTVHDTPDDKLLVGYVVPKVGAELTPDELRNFLAEKLPGYMIPGLLVRLDAMPVSHTGKVHRRKLRPVQDSFGPSKSSIVLSSDLGDMIAAVWANLLGAERVAPFDSFFALGGHSLLAAKLASRLSESLQIDIPAAAIFRFPTLAEFTRFVQEALIVGSVVPEELYVRILDTGPFRCHSPSAASGWPRG